MWRKQRSSSPARDLPRRQAQCCPLTAASKKRSHDRRTPMQQKAALAIALLALVVAATPRDVWKAERQYPPLVFISHATLECSVSVNAPGRQRMRTIDGQGFTFDATLLPLKTSSLLL